MDKMNSQLKFSNASVGSDQPIEVPETNHPSTASQQPQPRGEPDRKAHAEDRRESAQHDEPLRRSRRYYDDSDDMIDRIRRARQAFDRKANAFQGPDWSGYDKRIIEGKKKKPATSEASATSETSQSQNSASNSPVKPDKAKG